MNTYTLLGKKPTRHGFGEALVELGDLNENVVVLGGDITGSVLTSYFKEKFPDRFFSIGIAEQNATTIAAGLALSADCADGADRSAKHNFAGGRRQK